MRVGLVIVTFNAEPHIARCLEAVHRQMRAPDRIVLVDNASTDRTLAVVDDARRRHGLTVDVLPLGENLGFAVANNRAVERLSDCELVALLNPDAFPDV